MLKKLLFIPILGFLTACATTSYPTNVPLSEASSVFGAIGPLASAEGHRVNTHDMRLHIQFDSVTEIQYVADPEFTQGGTILIGVMVSDRELPPNEVDARMSAASKKAYEWLEQARARPAPAPVAAPVAAPAMSVDISVKVDASAAASVQLSSSCQKVLDCQAALAGAFCQAGGGNCQFKVEISGTDDAGCEEMLPDLRMMVEPLKMTVPGFTMPAVCQ
ncbi:MAG: hypothetical protein VX210_18025 [Myxococcota bacterium]|nr:hypothetical protein [Myxococcota bacterium]